MNHPNDFQTCRGNELCFEEVSFNELAKKHGTPLYVYSHAALTSRYKAFTEPLTGLDYLVSYSMKANSNAAILKTFINLGSGIDVVTGGELHRALKAGCDPKKIVFSGVGKSADEMSQALAAGILQFNVESEAELEQLSQVASALAKKAPVAFRINPDVDPKTHAYIATGLKKSKFGVPHERVLELYQKASKLPGIEVVGVDCHIGSQLTQVDPFTEAAQKVRNWVLQLRDAGIQVRHLDFGGGLGIVYKDETPPDPKKYAAALKEAFGDLKVKLILEPGRFLVGNSGVLLTKVLYNKAGSAKHFVIVDAASNDLMRPSLYGAYHGMVPAVNANRPSKVVDVVGPICETGDFFAHDRELPELNAGEVLVIQSAGAYGFSMSSTYNSRPRVAEVMVKGNQVHVVREREKLEDLTKGEIIPDFLK